MFKGPFDASIIKRAESRDVIKIEVHDLRKWGESERRNVDDRPFGGGPGMLLRVDIIDKALKSLITNHKSPTTQVILLDATGEKFTQQTAQNLSKIDHLILICGHYEGVDHRVHEHLVDKVISIGDYVLTGGEIPAMVLTDSIVRLIPDVIKPKSLTEESFSLVTNHQSLVTNIEYSQYTRPEEYKGWKVPKVLLSGNHKEIEKWRKKKL